EREYRCLGNWEEDGVLYTYTQRRDMPGHQCFAGKIYRSGDEAFIKEAGESCVRGEDPLIFGMKITKHASCPRQPPITSYVPIRPNWKPDKGFPMPPHQPSVYPPIRPLPAPGIKPILSPAPPRPAITRDPYWYDADTQPTTKSWRPNTTDRKIETKEEKNMCSQFKPFLPLVIKT
ncbi:unnamed protein product, partial [Medioppia subpectinata]